MGSERVVSSAIVVLLFFLGAVLVGAADSGEARRLFERKCSTCHSIERPKSQGKTKTGWQATVLRMKRHGARLSDGDAAAIVDYLARTYPKK